MQKRAGRIPERLESGGTCSVGCGSCCSARTFAHIVSFVGLGKRTYQHMAGRILLPDFVSLVAAEFIRWQWW